MNFIVFNLNKYIDTLSLNDVKNYTDRIHNIYYQAVGNSRLSQTLITLHNLCARAWFSGDYSRRPTQDTIDDWQTKIDMVENKEIEKLVKNKGKKIIYVLNMNLLQLV